MRGEGSRKRVHERAPVTGPAYGSGGRQSPAPPALLECAHRHDPFGNEEGTSMPTNKIAPVLTLALLAALVAVGAASAAPGDAKDPTMAATAELRKAVEPAGILAHERRFQRIADANGGTRSSGTPGYDASADYVAGKLEAAGYEVTRQEFDFPYFDVIDSSFSQTAPEQRDFEPYDPSTGEGDYYVMTYSGSGAVEDAPVIPTNDVQIPPGPEPSSSDSGCEP